MSDRDSGDPFGPWVFGIPLKGVLFLAILGLVVFSIIHAVEGTPSWCNTPHGQLQHSIQQYEQSCQGHS